MDSYDINPIIIEIVRNLVTQTPGIIASIVLLVAALVKLGKEKGAVLTLLGAIGVLLVMTCSPVVYPIVFRVVNSGSFDSGMTPIIFQVVSLVLNICLAIAIGLLAIGIFSRPTATSRQQTTPFARNAGQQP